MFHKAPFVHRVELKYTFKNESVGLSKCQSFKPYWASSDLGKIDLNQEQINSLK